MTRQAGPVAENIHEIRMILSNRILKSPERCREDIFDFCVPIDRNALVRGEQAYTERSKQLRVRSNCKQCLSEKE